MITMGIDLGIRKVAYSLWQRDKLIATEAHEARKMTRGCELMDCADFIYEAVRHTYPDNVWIEDNLVGNNVKYSVALAQTMGAVLLRLEERSQEVGGIGVYQVNVSTWKKQVVGNGRAKKEDVQEHLRSVNSEYAVLCGSDQDRYDAACIGYFGVLAAQRSTVSISG